MTRRQGLLDAVCSAASVDVDQHRANKGVLCSIENIVTTPKRNLAGVKSPVAKKQRRLEIDQGAQEVQRLDVSSLFSRTRSVLRQPPSASIQPPLGREQQSQLLVHAVQEFMSSGTGKSLYVSGLPGTGKSHTVRKVLQQLRSSNPEESTVTWVNCMSVTAAGQVYSQIASSAANGGDFQSAEDQQFSEPLADSDLDTTCQVELDLDFPAAPTSTGSSSTKNSITYKQLVDSLSKLQPSSAQQTPSRPTRRSYRATRSNSSSSQSSDTTAPAADSSPAATSSKTPSRGRKAKRSSTLSSTSAIKHIVVLDEIDNLMSKSQTDLMQLFILPHEPTVQVMVIGIANSIDLTERMLPELKLKMCSPRLICFPAYTTKQLSEILTTCLEQLPCKLIEPTAVELCSRSVGTSSGDLRHALKACRAAVDELERHQQQVQDAAATVTAPTSDDTPIVTVKYMMGALARLAGVRSSHFGAQATSSIRTLPNQQQLLLYSLSVLCMPKDAVEASNSKKTTSNLWATAGTASALKGSKKGGCTDSSSQQVFVLAVGLEEAFTQYKQVCKLLSLPPCSRAELQHMAELLAQMALVDVIRPAAGSGSGASRAMGSCGASGLKGLGGRGKGLGGFGGGKGLSKASGLQCGQQQDIKLCLKASVTEVESALKHNPALRCLVEN